MSCLLKREGDTSVRTEQSVARTSTLNAFQHVVFTQAQGSKHSGKLRHCGETLLRRCQGGGDGEQALLAESRHRNDLNK
ncbi:hypothetical protein MPTK1_5g14450 [Marchantia polymorpha subsp. ruderalis]|uniref:Uncharacterized protein n=2 Tax=Marchantia polymorpha TaxID=3197 RepID=A0AAF6BIC3_MARPO|nr:hypothetical protein MARPO_0032s0138 [Marchantia polymorpha]BBN11757.1 hypothetical protein Mp_5g14450 [Marchantia polymorpha subsp. ruderalis]|eukprot:PTQ41975.1 hypothetical protein MARPO_0032s0138 [Marchantia polymorpha]